MMLAPHGLGRVRSRWSAIGDVRCPAVRTECAFDEVREAAVSEGSRSHSGHDTDSTTLRTVALQIVSENALPLQGVALRNVAPMTVCMCLS